LGLGFLGKLHFCEQQTDALWQTGTIHPIEITTQKKPIFSCHPLQVFGPIFIVVSLVRLEGL